MRDQNALADCMVDGDPAIVLRYRRGQRRALLLAIAVEAALLAALLIVPLASPGVLPRRVTLSPSPPYSGGATQSSNAPRTGVHAVDRSLSIHDPLKWLTQSKSIPPHVRLTASGENSGASASSPLDLGYPGGLPDSPGLLGSTGPALRIDVPQLPPPRPAPHRIHSGGEVEQALLVHRVEPRYPALARQIHLEGTVQLHAMIGIDGTVHELEVESGHPLLAKAALDAVWQWHYRPTRLNGEPVEVETTITVIFELGP